MATQVYIDHMLYIMSEHSSNVAGYSSSGSQQLTMLRINAGFSNLANNLFYTHNTTAEFNEVVFYAGMVGVVASWLTHDSRAEMKQRFFFGHDNDVQCLNVHPNRRFVATGQQTATDGLPYVCIWDIGQYNDEDSKRLKSGDPEQLQCLGQPREPVQLQKLVLPKSYRSIIAVAFSGNQHASCSPGKPDKRGGELLITISADNHHTVHIWRWMVPAEKASSAQDKLLLSHCKAMYIPSWHFGPEKKLQQLHAGYKYFTLPEEGGPERYVPGTQTLLMSTVNRSDCGCSFSPTHNTGPFSNAG